MKGIIGRRVACHDGRFVVGRVVAFSLKYSETFMLLVECHGGALVSVPDHAVRTLGKAEYEQLLHKEKKQLRKLMKSRRDHTLREDAS